MMNRYAKIAAWTCLGLWLCAALHASAQESQCATVKMEIAQDLALERQAFDARMRIANQLDTVSLENLSITLQFSDADGNVVVTTTDPDDTGAARFFVRIDSMTGIGDVAGHGSLPSGSAAEIHWLIIPRDNAAADNPSGTRYLIGATVTYTLGGNEETLAVTPDTVTVLPLPRLVLDYFLTRHVYGDDPFTPAIEPVEPFTLGLRVTNAAFGIARDVAIDSAEPEIVDNRQGLLVAFRLLGSSIDDQSVTPTLRLDFGDIGARSARVGRWAMEATLSGEITDFSAALSHADALGGRSTSLIQAAFAHSLVHDVRVDLPGRDAIRDFLAYEGPDGGMLRVYESNAIDTLVSDQSAVSTLDQQTDRLVLDGIPATAGPLFVQKPDPFRGTRVVRRAVRSDGKVLPLDNAWFSKSGQGSDTQYAVNLFDVNGGGQYVLDTESRPDEPHAPVLAFVPDRGLAAGDRVTFVVQASDPDGTIPRLGSGPLPLGASFIDTADGHGIFDWQTTPGQTGIYSVTFRATDGSLEAAQSMRIFVGVDTPTSVPTPTATTTPTPSITPTAAALATASDTPTPTATPLCGADPSCWTRFFVVVAQRVDLKETTIADASDTTLLQDPFAAAGAVVCSGESLLNSAVVNALAATGEVHFTGDQTDVRYAYIDVGQRLRVGSHVPLVGPGRCSTNAAASCVSAADCAPGDTCTGRQLLIDAANPFVDHSGSAPTVQRCLDALTRGGAMADAVANLPATENYADGIVLRPSETRTITIGTGRHVLDIATLKLGPQSTLTIDAQPGSMVVIRIPAKGKLNFGTGAAVRPTGGIDSDALLWSVAGDGASVKIGKQAHIAGTILASGRTVKILRDATVAGAVIANRTILLQGSTLEHHPFTSATP